jgi:hypothetical protein
MTSIQHRDSRLHELYRNRKFLEFMYGESYFEQQVRDIHWEWEQSGTFLKVSDTDILISMVAFEMDNGYLKEDAQ